MENKEISVLEIPFLNTTEHDLVRYTENILLKKEKQFIVTANPEIVMYAQKDDHYKQILRSANIVIPDGIGIIIASKMLGTPLKERIAGFDFMQKLLHVANNHRMRIFLLGAREDVVRQTKENIQKQFPNIQIVGFRNGYFDIKDSSVLKMVQETKPDLVFVALGFPKQERWIYEHLDQFSSGVFLGVGGSFDVISGKVKRAPKLWRKMNLEWLYRLIQQPSRWKRMTALPKFLFEIWKVRKKK